jgi:hypothetical protein
MGSPMQFGAPLLHAVVNRQLDVDQSERRE